MVSRRVIFSVGGALATASAISQQAAAQDADKIDPIKDWGFRPPGSIYSDSKTTAYGPARSEDVAKAVRLLFNAPRGKEPAEVAAYFEALKRTEKPTSDGYFWNEEWPATGQSARPNPVIVGFFSMTNTMPSRGDETFWCAAFVNFCLAVAGRPIEWSAWALDFMKYGTPTTDPKVGDLVVFSRPGGGHVGFYKGRYSDSNGKELGTLVLAGNQEGGSPGSQGAVTIGRVPYGSSLKIQGYRIIPTTT